MEAAEADLEVYVTGHAALGDAGSYSNSPSSCRAAVHRASPANIMIVGVGPVLVVWAALGLFVRAPVWSVMGMQKSDAEERASLERYLRGAKPRDRL